jgi:hypothetical protein
LLNKELNLKDTVILFDRDEGISIFPNFRSYDNVIDDAEWLLERTPQKSRGFIIRPVSRKTKEGIWIGEYNHRDNQINRQDFSFDEEASNLNKTISDYSSRRRIPEKKFRKEIDIDQLRKKLKSKIIQDFKYYTCPTDRFYQSCTHIEKVHAELTRKHGKGKKIPYDLVAQEITKTKPCQDVIVCPLMVPNLFERVLNLNKALKIRRLGEIKFITSTTVELA